ncbi:NAD(P)/FAD-dependent oxidoreductase [Aureimonas populi]|uniref:NAD(P)/FAD-dependent oxidoreductase n=1 Tax=Aureimonas populi TaxID=1701758 RepID=A0ABW5CN93_9HYPH|nr:FAD-dependent oxidoreductase [Aureimonas populi]
MDADVIVLGAGMVGVSTALQLRRQGRSVVLVDRRGPGEETSYGNAGIIQREAVEPYGFPRDLPSLFRAARKGGLDVHYHARALPALFPRFLRYWLSSSPGRYRPLAAAHARLIEHSIAEHAPLIAQAGAEHLVRREGLRFGFRDTAAFEREARDAERIVGEYGLECAILDGAQLQAAEPALLRPLAGAVHWLDSWSVRDPGALVGLYAALFEAEGGTFLRGDARSLRPQGAGWEVRCADGPVRAGEVVLALGPWADEATRALGYRLPLFVKRGYHRHYRTAPSLNVPLLDAQNGFLMAPMERGLRITTGAEFAAHTAPATPVQSAGAERIARQLVPLGEAVEAEPWLGARPCTPDMLPVIGPAPRHKGLWFHFGHAHQGFTLGPATARLLAEMMSGQTPYVDPTPYSPGRFAGSRA